MERNLGWIVVVLLALGAACAPGGVVPAAEVRLEGEVLLDPEESGLLRSMLGMVTHPDGSIYVNTQTQQRLYKSVDQGRSWTMLPVNLSGAPPGQVQHGLYAGRDGRLWLMHQSPGGKDLFVSVSSDSGITWKTTAIDFRPVFTGRVRGPLRLLLQRLQHLLPGGGRDHRAGGGPALPEPQTIMSRRTGHGRDFTRR